MSSLTLQGTNQGRVGGKRLLSFELSPCCARSAGLLALASAIQRTVIVVSTRLALGVVAVLALGSYAAAAEWIPTRPIKLIVPFTAGGAADLTARVFNDKLATALGQPVVIDNRGGAGGISGTEAGVKSPPDGYTLIMGSDANITINPNLGALSYDPLKDLEPVSLIVNLPMLLVINPQKVPAGNVKELIALAKASPGKYTIASSGNGSSHHLAAELLKQEAGIDLLHVPYKGQAQAVTDLLGGQVDMAFGSLGPMAPYIKGGKLKALAISVSQRFPDLPDVPALSEGGVPGYDLGIWIGVMYPAGTPAPIVERVSSEISRILESPDVRARYASIGYTPVGGKPEVLAKRIQRDTLIYRNLIKNAKIKPN